MYYLFTVFKKWPREYYELPYHDKILVRSFLMVYQDEMAEEQKRIEREVRSSATNA